MVSTGGGGNAEAIVSCSDSVNAQRRYVNGSDQQLGRAYVSCMP